MPSHKFQIGETAYVSPAISRNVPGGAYAVTKQLPHNGREFEYRIKSASEEHERSAFLKIGHSPASRFSPLSAFWPLRLLLTFDIMR